MRLRQPSGRDELLEREAELEAVGDLVGVAGHSGSLLVVEGPPGIGKTALLAAAKERGQAAGLQVLSARGSELERLFSFGIVRQLFEPLLASGRGDERAGLLSGPAGLAASVFDPAQIASDRATDASLATLHGLYWLTANLAERKPLLLALDDLQWADLASLRWLLYLLPRMEGLRLALVVALRPEAPDEQQALVARVVSDPLAVCVRPGVLSAPTAARMLGEVTSARAEDAFAAACHNESGGNPLLLRELVRAVAAEGLEPVAANASHVHEIAARAGSRTVSVRLSSLGHEATKLAQAVAVLGDDADPQLAGALAELDGATTSEAASALARVDVLRPSAPFGFVHPLVAAAVYETMTPGERESAHAQAARLLVAGGAEPERAAAHLLRSQPCGDPAVVAVLRRTARRAGSQGASESAVAYLRRALAEPPPGPEQAEVLAELGSAEAHLEGQAAVEHLRSARGLVEDPVQRARVSLVLARQLFFLDDEEAETVYTVALEQLSGADAELEHLLLAGLVHAGLFVPDRHEPARLRLEQVRGKVTGRTLGEKQLLSLLAFHDALSGAPATEVVPRARLALADGELVRAGLPAAVLPLCTLLGMADLDEVLVVFEDVIAEAHRRGSALTYAAARAFRAQTLLWRGDLAEAEADSREALSVAATWGATARFAGHATAFLAASLMEQGKLDEAGTAMSEARSLPQSARRLYLRHSGACLRALRGDLAGGAAELLDACAAFGSVGMVNPALIAWRSPAALALLQLGDRGTASRLAAEELDLARGWGAPRALGSALRVAGLAGEGKNGLAPLREAVEVLSGSPAKLELAKAHTELGATLRRTGQRVQAREHLRRGAELASFCGAAPLAQRAETELLATGARPRRIALSGLESLTPSERRVAELAAEGPTNREIAQALFVTQRTVEVHMTSVFRKLAISSRSQLASALAGPGKR
jgi:DNA-binding CsgD family transcriptional regulator